MAASKQPKQPKQPKRSITDELQIKKLDLHNLAAEVHNLKDDQAIFMNGEARTHLHLAVSILEQAVQHLHLVEIHVNRAARMDVLSRKLEDDG